VEQDLPCFARYNVHDVSVKNSIDMEVFLSGKRRIRKIQSRHPQQHSKNSKSDELGNENMEFPSICFKDIVTATDDFSDYNVLGKGGFGSVYKVTRNLSLITLVQVLLFRHYLV
jgi:hypothetical protein